MANGPYGVIDKDGYFYTTYNRTNLLKAFDDNQIDAPLRAVKHVNVLDLLPTNISEQTKDLHLKAISMSYDGHLVAAASGGVFVFDRDLTLRDHMFFPGEHVENGIAIDEKRIYVTTSKHMYGLDWDGESLSAEGAWLPGFNQSRDIILDPGLSEGAVVHEYNNRRRTRSMNGLYQLKLLAEESNGAAPNVLASCLALVVLA